MHALSGHVHWTTSSTIMKVKVGTMKEEESARIIATMEGGEEECCLTLPERLS